jgi:hypothetical protein
MADQLSAYRAAVAKSHQLKLKQEKTAYVAEAEWWKKKSSNGRKVRVLPTRQTCPGGAMTSPPLCSLSARG